MLAVTPERAKKLLRAQMRDGRELKQRRPSSDDSCRNYAIDAESWSSDNHDTLTTIFGAGSIASQYKRKFPAESIVDEKSYAAPDAVRSEIGDRIRFLDRTLNLLSDQAGDSTRNDPGQAQPKAATHQSAKPRPRSSKSGQVFVVHGHDELAKQTIARFLEKLGLEAVILHEQASKGATVIEKLEDHSNVDFAVVLLTPDDVGASKKAQNDLRDRARQNVVLELGFFIGKLGRAHVCALHKGNVELPSDFLGVVFVPMDERGAWKFDLAKELGAAGMKMDTSGIIKRRA